MIDSILFNLNKSNLETIAKECYNDSKLSIEKRINLKKILKTN